jgi:pimeloyl-ACP methyl ester carboxylesterase
MQTIGPFPRVTATRSACGLMPDRPHQDPSGAIYKDNGYYLSIVEFDDQGLCHDRRQLLAVMDLLEQPEIKNSNPIIIVFVHGWRHDGRGDDENLSSFRGILSKSSDKVLDGRPIVGVFVAWRGLSWYGLGIENATFFSRKQAALRVALGATRELFGRLRHYREKQERKPVLILVGHSFGGLILFSAVAQTLIEQAALGDNEIIRSFGDLVILVNPAFEAARYLPIHQQIHDRQGFAHDQGPVFISITAKNDRATGFWFPKGMLLEAFGESTTGFDAKTARREKEALRHTMGHLDWMATHTVSAPSDVHVRAREQTSGIDRFSSAGLAEYNNAVHAAAIPVHLTLPSGSRLTRAAGIDAQNPFWVVRAEKEVIDDHNGITGFVFSDLVRDLAIVRMDDTNR